MNKFIIIALLHTIIIGPLLFYISYKGIYDHIIYNSEYQLLGILGIMTFIYHLRNLLLINNII
jgi:hypothetical protein